MKQLSFAKTEKEIKKELKLFKDISRKIAVFGEFNAGDVRGEIARLLTELRKIKKGEKENEK